MRIAIVKLSALGDIIHAMVVLQYIKKAFPHILIDWFVDARFEQILHNNPHIHQVYALGLKSKNRNYHTLYKSLKALAIQNGYDCIIDLQGLIKSALIAKTLGVNTVGFDRKSAREPLAALFYRQKCKIAYEKNVIMRNLELVCQALHFPIPNVQTKEPFLLSNRKSNLKPELLIITGSSWKSKVYPKEKFVEVINALSVETYVSWGNKQEEENALFICEHTNAKILPALDLDTLKSIVSNSSLVIGADSGPTHMAWAMNRPSITIFGPTPAKRNTLETPINKTIDCKKEINPKKINKKDPCIATIPPQEIVKMAKELLAC
jgi:heptosyltransferase-1